MFDWWFPGLTVGLIIVAGAVAFLAWRFGTYGRREDRRDARRQGRGDHDPKKGAP